MDIRLEAGAASMVPSELQDRTDYLLCKVADTVKRGSDAAFAEAGVRGAHHALLRVLSSRGAIPQKDLTAALHVDQSTVVDLVDQLEVMELVVRTRNPADRRSYLLELSALGRRTLSEADDVAGRIQDELFSGVSARERMDLHALLLKLATIPE